MWFNGDYTLHRSNPNQSCFLEVLDIPLCAHRLYSSDLSLLLWVCLSDFTPSSLGETRDKLSEEHDVRYVLFFVGRSVWYMYNWTNTGGSGCLKSYSLNNFFNIKPFVLVKKLCRLCECSL